MINMHLVFCLACIIFFIMLIIVASMKIKFSKQKVLKFYLVSNMFEIRENNLALISIENEFFKSIDY